MSDTNRVLLSIVSEGTGDTTFGVTPTSPAFENLRVTTGGLQFNPKTITSNEARSDGQVTDLVLVDADAQGSVGFEVSYGAQDTLLEGAFRSSWVNNPTIVNVTADSSITDAGTVANTFTVASGGAAFKTGHVVQSSGFTNAANNQIFRATSSSATTVVGTSLGLTAEAVPPAGARLRVVGFQGASGDLTTTTSSGNAILSTALDFTTLGLVAGMWIKVGGTAAGDKFATAALNDWCRISAITATRISLDRAPSGWAIDNGSGKTVKVWIGDYLRNGVTERSYTIERQYQDHSPVDYEVFTGMEVSQFDLRIDVGVAVTGSAAFIGKAAATSTTRTSGATDVAAPTNSVFNATSNVGRFAEGGTAVVGPNFVLGAQITINTNLRAQKQVGLLGTGGVGLGEWSCTGQFQTYFGDNTLYAKVINNTATSFDIRFNDSANHAFVLDLPQMKYSSGAPNVGAKNQDVTMPLGFQAYRHATLGYTAQVMRFAYVE